MTKARLMTTAAFVLAFAAGVLTGSLVRDVESSTAGPRSGPSRLSEELGLSTEQQAQLRDVWSKIAEEFEHADRDKFRSISAEKDERVRAMLSEEQRAAYDQIMAEFREQRNALEDTKRARHDAAVAATMAILSDEQKTKYQKLLDEQKKSGRFPRMDGPPKGNGSPKPDR